MKAKHTPGPWTIHIQGIRSSVPRPDWETGRMITHPVTTGENGRKTSEDRANEALIATAPELLTVAKWAREVFGKAAGHAALIALGLSEIERRASLNALNAAIRKAEGLS